MRVVLLHSTQSALTITRCKREHKEQEQGLNCYKNNTQRDAVSSRVMGVLPRY